MSSKRLLQPHSVLGAYPASVADARFVWRYERCLATAADMAGRLSLTTKTGGTCILTIYYDSTKNDQRQMGIGQLASAFGEVRITDSPMRKPSLNLTSILSFSSLLYFCDRMWLPQV